MKYLKAFNNFENLFESQVLYSKNLVEQLKEYSKKLIELPDVRSNLMMSLLMTKKLTFGLSNSLQLYHNKEFRVNVSEILYKKDMITKGAFIMREFLDYLRKINDYVSITEGTSDEEILLENIKAIIQGKKEKKIEDIWISVIFIPFVDIENSIFKKSPRDDVQGAFSSALPDMAFLNYKSIYSNSEEFCKNWKKLCSDGSVYKVRFSANIRTYYLAHKAWFSKNDYLIQYDNLLRHELTHLTQFLNSLCLKLFENCRDNLTLGKVSNYRTNKLSSISLRKVLSETMSETLVEKDIKVGVPKTSFLKQRSDLSDSDFRSYYHGTPDEFKTWMSDQTRKFLQKQIDKNKKQWELAKSGDTNSLQFFIDSVTKEVLSNRDVMMIPGENLKRKEIERLIKRIVSEKI